MGAAKNSIVVPMVKRQNADYLLACSTVYSCDFWPFLHETKTVTKFIVFSAGTYELMLGFCFKKERKSGDSVQNDVLDVAVCLKQLSGLI